jgi:hypothetical protein
LGLENLKVFLAFAFGTKHASIFFFIILCIFGKNPLGAFSSLTIRAIRALSNPFFSRYALPIALKAVKFQGEVKYFSFPPQPLKFFRGALIFF